ncbi:MAG: hypothetical protein WD875_08690 [Pirellulales bacterium]
MNAQHQHQPEPTEAAATLARERDAERQHLRQQLVRLIAEREVAKHTAKRVMRDT